MSYCEFHVSSEFMADCLTISWGASSSPLRDSEMFFKNQRATRASPPGTGRVKGRGGKVSRTRENLEGPAGQAQQRTESQEDVGGSKQSPNLTLGPAGPGRRQ